MEKESTLTAALEDYLEAIFHLCQKDQAARSRDIVESLKVHKSTVTAALKHLGQMNLINYAPYEAVTLTPEGRRLAKDVVERHEALRGFFVDVLQVNPEIAETAACGMEHAVPREIVEKLALFARRMRYCRLHDDGGTTEICTAQEECPGLEVVRKDTDNFGASGRKPTPVTPLEEAAAAGKTPRIRESQRRRARML